MVDDCEFITDKITCELLDHLLPFMHDECEICDDSMKFCDSKCD